MVFGVGGGVFGVSATGSPGVAVFRGIPNPVNNLVDFQVEFNGFLLGHGTQYKLPVGGFNFLDAAQAKTMDVPRVWADGNFSGPDFADLLLPALQVRITGGGSLTQFQANVAAFRTAFGIQTNPVPLWFKVPGQPVMGVNAKINQRSIPIGPEWLRAGYTIAALQFRVPDPIWQAIPRTLTLTASGGGGGMVFPLFNFAAGAYASPGTLDYGNAAVASSAGTITNVGNTPAWPLIMIPGPQPSGFSIIIGGNTVTYSGVLQASDSLTIDYSTGQATLNGATDRTYLLTSRQFAPVPPNGTVSAFFSAASGTANLTTSDLWR